MWSEAGRRVARSADLPKRHCDDANLRVVEFARRVPPRNVHSENLVRCAACGGRRARFGGGSYTSSGVVPVLARHLRSWFGFVRAVDENPAVKATLASGERDASARQAQQVSLTRIARPIARLRTCEYCRIRTCRGRAGLLMIVRTMDDRLLAWLLYLRGERARRRLRACQGGASTR